MAVSKKLKAYFDDSTSGNCFCDCKYNNRFKKWEVIGINEKAKIAANIQEIKNFEERKIFLRIVYIVMLFRVITLGIFFAAIILGKFIVDQGLQALYWLIVFVFHSW